MREQNGIYVGVMSGTSGDGVDVAAVRLAAGTSVRWEVVGHLHRAFKPGLRSRLMGVMAPADTSTEEIARLNQELALVYGDAVLAMVRKLGPRRRPVAVGLSGQTVCHYPPTGVGRNTQLLRANSKKGRDASARDGKPTTVTLQLGNPQIVAARTGLPVIGEFRQTDVAVGGQGAPLVPWTDWVLFGGGRQSRAIQNIGGIGNVTWLRAGGGPEDVIAFDTGPGNMVIDALVERVTRGRETFDRDGRRAAQGRVLQPILARWLDRPYFRQKPPKTTGREVFGRKFVDAELPVLRQASARRADWIATATAFTAHAIVDGYRRFLLPSLTGLRAGADRGSPLSTEIEVVLAGGGARNAALRRMIAAAAPSWRIRTIDELGISAEAKEAVSFALLAWAFVTRRPSNLPQVTGARLAVPLGVGFGPPAGIARGVR